MIVKRISCQVKENQADAFSKYQEQWQPLNQITGFLGQVGGWSIKNQFTACIVSFWQSKDDYDYFMDYVHDDIFLNMDQSNTYTAIDVELFNTVFEIPGVEENIISVLKESHFIRTALCDVKDGRTSRFIEIQRSVWNPGLKMTGKMLGREFSSSLKADNRFFVFTGWLSKEAHQEYLNLTFPALKNQAMPELDLEEMIGEQFIIENS